jgi:tRNA A-37 threonylcarbamoyl transferase component Bud32
MLAYPEIGQVVGGKYRVERVLGEGGMGIVLAAINITTGKRVALKWMHPHVSADPVATERLLREAQVAARVRHPNVIDIYDVSSHDGSLFLVMEYLEGESLRSLLSRGSAPATDVLALLLGAMRGASEAHKRGVIHRDIKPENIFLARQGNDDALTPMLLDFGISKLALLDPSQLPLTKTGATFGTPVYMSYEQLSGEPDLDVRTDVYSFGVVLYELLTGRLPYEADSFPAIIIKIATEVPVPLREYSPHLPLALERVVLSALRKDRDKRLDTVDQLRIALEPFVGDPSLRNALGPARAVSRSLGRKPTLLQPVAMAAGHSAFPRLLERALRVRVLLLSAGLCVLLALLLAAFKLGPREGAPPLPTRIPATALALTQLQRVAATGGPSTSSGQTTEAALPLALRPAQHAADAAVAHLQEPTELAAMQPSRARSVRTTQTSAAPELSGNASRSEPAAVHPAHAKLSSVTRKPSLDPPQPASLVRRRRVETPRMEEF